MATAIFTEVEARVNQQLSNAIWADEIKDNVNQLAGSHRTQIVNGGMELAQRGAGPFTANNAWTLDRWQIQLQGAGTATVTPETTTVDGSAQSMKVVVTGTAGNGVRILQKLENLLELRGKQVSLSLRVNQNVASGLTPIYVGNGSSATVGSGVATTGSFVTLTQTVTPSAAATSIEFGFQVLGAAGTYYVDNVMLVIGPAPAPYRPLHPQEDLARCQRYYEVMGGVQNTIYFQGYQAATTQFGGTLFWRVTKGGTPTITKNGTWGVTNCGQPAVGDPSVNSCFIQALATALGNCAFQTNSSDDTVTVEYNP